MERKLGRAFREHGQAPASIVKQWQLFLLAPRPGSFTVTLRIGRPEQPLLPGLEDAFEPEIIDDLLTNFELLNSSREDELHRRIPEESYYRNSPMRKNACRGLAGSYSLIQPKVAKDALIS